MSTWETHVQFMLTEHNNNPFWGFNIPTLILILKFEYFNNMLSFLFSWNNVIINDTLLDI